MRRSHFTYSTVMSAAAALAALVVLVGTPAAVGAVALTPTTGAVTLNAAKLKAVEGTRCGLIGRAWLPGALVRGRLLSHTRRAANYTALAARASGRRARTLRAQAASFRSQSVAQRPACGQPNGARKLSANSVKQVGAGWCAAVGTEPSPWVPGTLRSGYFVTYAQQAENFKTQARFAIGQAKQALLAQAANFQRLHDEQVATCNPTTTLPVSEWTDIGVLPLGAWTGWSPYTIYDRYDPTQVVWSGYTTPVVFIGDKVGAADYTYVRFQLAGSVTQTGQVKCGFYVAATAADLASVYPLSPNNFQFTSPTGVGTFDASQVGQIAMDSGTGQNDELAANAQYARVTCEYPASVTNGALRVEVRKP